MRQLDSDREFRRLITRSATYSRPESAEELGPTRYLVSAQVP